jgi:hypothetical protein
MIWHHALLLFAAGIAGGLTGSVAGLASVAIAGGAAGAALLLLIPAEGFTNVVPVLLALFPHAGSESLAHTNAAKNVLLGAANGVAALGFIVFAPVHWATVLRLAIAAAGLALAVKLGFDAYR